MEPMLCSHFTYKEDSLNLMLVLLTLIISTEAQGGGSEEAGSGEGSESPCGTLQGTPELRADFCWQSDRYPHARGRGQWADASVRGALGPGGSVSGCPLPRLGPQMSLTEGRRDSQLWALG